MTPPGGEIGVTSLPVSQTKSLKSLIARKRYVMEQKLTLNTNRKSAIAFQNLPFYLTCDAIWRRNRRYVTSGFTNKITKIAYNSETLRDRTKVNINHKYEVGYCLSESAILFDL